MQHLRALFALIAVRAQCKLLRLARTIENPVTVHTALPLGGGSVLYPDDSVGVEPPENLAPWRQA